MDLSTARQKFFKKNPNTFANFIKNEKLGKNLCFVYDYRKENLGNNLISEDLKLSIENANLEGGSEFDKVIEYFAINGIDDETLEKISTCYYNALVEKRNFSCISDVCDYINTNTANTDENSTNTRSIVSCYEVNTNGDLNDDRLFYMEVTLKNTNSGNKVCVIENTFTEEQYRGCGLHGYSIKFLEAVMAQKNVSSIIGESVDMDLYANGSLDNHYKNLGFEVTTNKFGESKLYKYIDPENSMQITNDNELER